MLKRVLTVSVLLLCACRGYGQGRRPLTDGRTKSYYTYIYAVDDKDMGVFYGPAKKRETLDERVLGKPLDSMPSERFHLPHLKPGNYLKVYAEENAINYQLIEKHSAFLKLLDNQKDLRFMILDLKGNEVQTALVLLNNRKLRYDARLHLYSARRKKKGATVVVKYDGVSNYFSQGEEEPRRLFHTIMQPKVAGFIAFNKPMYKPGDTVRYKAYVFDTRAGKPIKQKKLTIKLAKEDYNHEATKVLGEIQAYRDGLFESSFVLADSLKLTLDNEYTLTLGDTKVTGSFRYEDYELKSVKFSMRSADNQRAHYLGGLPKILFFKATDENDLAVADGRVELLLITSNVMKQTKKEQFIPDTLWRHSFTLDQDGETRVEIPDSIYPPAEVWYSAEAHFLNSDNQSQNQSLYLHSTPRLIQITDTSKNDSIKLNYEVNGRRLKEKIKARIEAINSNGDTIKSMQTELPCSIKLDPAVTSYSVHTDSASADLEVRRNYTAQLYARATRTKDSLTIKIDNPRKIPFWYTVFTKNRIYDAGGNITVLNYKKKLRTKIAVSLLINYVWGGEAQHQEVTLESNENKLRLKLEAPVTVDPGQDVGLEVSVTNQAGRAVGGADVTAYAANKKFTDFREPYIKPMGRIKTIRKLRRVLTIENKADSGAFVLNWKRWSREMGLDSMLYFRFTHSQGIYRVEEPAPDAGLTQIAPFVVKDGEVQPVYTILIDEKPVWFSQAEQLQNYSFRVAPGIGHQIKLRTLHQTIKIENVLVKKGVKLIIAVSADSVNNHEAQFTKMPDILTPDEAATLDRSMITVVNNFGLRMATLSQGNDLRILNPSPESDQYNRPQILTGPLEPAMSAVQVKGSYTRQFNPKGGYAFAFAADHILQKSVPGEHAFSTNLRETRAGIPRFGEYVLTPPAVDSLWQNYLDERSYYRGEFIDWDTKSIGTGRLVLAVAGYNEANLPLHGEPLVKRILLYRDDDPEFLGVYAGMQTRFQTLLPGTYRAFYLLKGDRYYVQNGIRVRANGYNFLKLRFDAIHVKDSLSGLIAGVLREWMLNDRNTQGFNIYDDLRIRKALHPGFVGTLNYKNVISGLVSDTLGKPIAGASILIEGTRHGTLSDINGRFRMMGPSAGIIRVMLLGYQTATQMIQPGIKLSVFLAASESLLTDAVTVGYSTKQDKEFLSLARPVEEAGESVNIQGMARMEKRDIGGGSGLRPLYVVDGIIVEAGEAGVDPANIASMSILRDQAAVALYGERGVGGVIVITTKKNGKSLPAGSAAGGSQEQSFRHNFSDYAFWQPRLVTDAGGIARFKVHFPDDITAWNTVAIGLNGAQTGSAEKVIKAYKSLSANLVGPAFAIEGDELSVIGKVMNYTSTPVTVDRSFKFNGLLVKQGALSITSATIDTFKVKVPADQDSIGLEYTIKRSDGYFDGERRKIPVYKQGVLESKGVFAALEKDTVITLQFDPAKGPVIFHAEASLLPVLRAETEHLRRYEYLCNEQLASKLIGLLSEKRICTYLGERFKWNREVLGLIIKLQDNQRLDGAWGWWKETSVQLWVSRHAIEALLEAGKEGYSVRLNKERLISYLAYQAAIFHGREKLESIQLLLDLDAKVDYAALIAAYDHEPKSDFKLSEFESVKRLLLMQQAGLLINVDSLLLHGHTTMLGNVYWGEQGYRFFDNSIQISLMAYQLLRAEGHYLSVLPKIRNYFLEQRRDGFWRNTYESALIFKTILPDLLAGSKTVEPSSLEITGSVNEKVLSFPYTKTIPSTTAQTGLQPGAGSSTVFKLRKTGPLPVYVSAYQQLWNKTPERISKDFMVSTWFENAGTRLPTLTGGKPIVLKAEVTARSLAPYVMIEIPIPAGCSYDSKDQQSGEGEVHREYFKNKVSIFCQQLTQGKHSFEVRLMPRYSGKYSLNPAKAELMYFPVFYGREVSKHIIVQ